MFDLILSTESKVLSTNIDTFKKQAEQYLANLTKTFETDEDFGQAKAEIKDLGELEKKTRTAIDNVLNGNQEIAALIDTAKEIAERFRTERLNREKLVKAKEAELKESLATQAITEIDTLREQLVKESDISIALSMTFPKSTINNRIKDSQKNKRTIDSLTKAINAEKTLIITEMTAEVTRLINRLEQIKQSGKIWLFNDAVELIASDADLAEIIKQRIEEEQQREAELKAQAEQEAKEKAEAIAAIKEKLNQSKKEINEQAPQTETQVIHQETQAETAQFILKIPAQEIPFTGTLEQLREYFAPVKALGIKATISRKNKE
ncbi:hypothetical protein [Gallibacterium anatis]|uniref:Uncharacterized protein n=1 Tax=Gallibacterium anatis TaxID=750 RepID=A0A0A2XP71_9PAST|nr:hypothetical protein [Gallibacterium anatis]KGQ34131.1 hypothetical protein JP32_01350 [Gallibacterium anatis]